MKRKKTKSQLSIMELIAARNAIATRETMVRAHRRSALRRSALFVGLVGLYVVEFFRHSGALRLVRSTYLGDSIVNLGTE
ncbi:hypothetical protein PspLS_05681 [Pyricularia sp. CBS 133598]|nr:hypothetical protein PspLS_05681 [Pyricularia sp. CBS 133598]